MWLALLPDFSTSVDTLSGEDRANVGNPASFRKGARRCEQERGCYTPLCSDRAHHRCNRLVAEKQSRHSRIDKDARAVTGACRSAVVAENVNRA